MKKYRIVLFAILLLFLYGCGKENTDDSDSASDNEIQLNEEAIQTEDSSAADEGSVTDDSALISSLLTVSGNAPAVQSEVDSNKRIVTVQRITTDGTTPGTATGTISSAPSTYTPDDSITSTSENTVTGSGTPATFDVGSCMIQVDGTYDTKLSGEILTALNNARTQAGLDAFDTNASLGKVADVRAKEITYSVSHLRANGSYWSTVAPQYYEAECLAVDYTDAVTTVNAWLSDEATRQYLLSSDLNSIGVSCFQYANNYYIAASLGK